MFVIIKSWEEMEKEFGVDRDGDINCECYFTVEMKPLCNTMIEIIKERNDGVYTTVDKDNFTWNISEDMIKEYCE